MGRSRHAILVVKPYAGDERSKLTRRSPDLPNNSTKISGWNITKITGIFMCLGALKLYIVRL